MHSCFDEAKGAGRIDFCTVASRVGEFAKRGWRAGGDLVASRAQPEQRSYGAGDETRGTTGPVAKTFDVVARPGTEAGDAAGDGQAPN